MAITSTGQIFMIFYSPISKNTHKMGKISNFNSFEILGHPNVGVYSIGISGYVGLTEGSCITVYNCISVYNCILIITSRVE